MTPKKNVRKRIPKPSSWKCSIRKTAHQQGKEYISRRGKKVAEKGVKNKKDCLNCKYKCSQKISEIDRADLNASFYSLKNATEKRHFILEC